VKFHRKLSWILGVTIGCPKNCPRLDLSGAFQDWTRPISTGLVQYLIVPRPTLHKFSNPYSFLSILLCLIILMLLYLRLMDSHRDKRSKKGQDEVGPSKRGCRAVVVHRPPPPRPTHHPSHSSDEEEDPKAFKIHSPQERTKWVVLKYSKKTKQETINEAHGAPITPIASSVQSEVLVLLPLGLVLVHLSPQEGACDRDQVGKLGVDGDPSQPPLQPNQRHLWSARDDRHDEFQVTLGIWDYSKFQFR
jgi:hypothetical protein